jgi:glucan phosphorylase
MSINHEKNMTTLRQMLIKAELVNLENIDGIDKHLKEMGYPILTTKEKKKISEIGGDLNRLNELD